MIATFYLREKERVDTCGGVERDCGDASCDGGVEADGGPDQLYPGQITVPVGCNCRTCRGCSFLVSQVILMGFRLSVSEMRLFNP